MTYRLVSEEDAPVYLDFFIAVAGETDNLAATRSEASMMSIDDERTFLRNMGQSFSVAAFEDGVICGSCDIRINGRERLRHRAELGIAVRMEWWGRGIAQHLIETALSEAFARGVRKVMLTVRADNSRAISLYERNGFSCIGKDSMLFCIDGEYEDGFIFEKILTGKNTL